MVRNRFPKQRSVQPFPAALLPNTFNRAGDSDPSSEPDVPYVVTLLQALHHLEKARRKEDTSETTSPGL